MREDYKESITMEKEDITCCKPNDPNVVTCDFRDFPSNTAVGSHVITYDPMGTRYHMTRIEQSENPKGAITLPNGIKVQVTASEKDHDHDSAHDGIMNAVLSNPGLLSGVIKPTKQKTG